MEYKIPLFKPNIGPVEKGAVAKAINSGWISGGGEFVEKFEEQVAKFCGKRHCIATLTGSAAIQAAAYALGWRHKSVEVGQSTFPAARNVLSVMGAVVSGPAGYGTNHDCCEMREGGTQWPILVDAAPAVGNLPDVNALAFCLSFNGNKTITTGQGGAILTDDGSFADECRRVIHQGIGKEYAPFNYRMANVNAAIGCAQMEVAHALIEKKKVIWDFYNDHLDMVDTGKSRWLSVADMRHHKGWTLGAHLGEKGIECKQYAAHNGLWCLPCFHGITEEQQHQVIDAIMEPAK